MVSMTTTTVKNGMVSLGAITKIVKNMMDNGVYQIKPSSESDVSYYNPMVNDIIIDEEKNVLVAIKDSNEVILPKLAMTIN